MGIICEENSVGADILKRHGLDYKSVKQAVILLNGSGSRTLPPPSMTPRLRSVIENAAKEMPGAFGRIGTEQLLKAILNEKESVASRMIEKQRALEGQVYVSTILFSSRSASSGS